MLVYGNILAQKTVVSEIDSKSGVRKISRGEGERNFAPHKFY